VDSVLVTKISRMFSIAVKVQLEKDKIELDLACCKCFPYLSVIVPAVCQ